MGAWGEGPLDNDTALDWISDLKARKALIGDITKGLNKRDPDKNRAAAELIVLGYKAKILDNEDAASLIPRAIKQLNRILMDKVWVGVWKSPTKIKRSLQRQIRRLERLAKDL